MYELDELRDHVRDFKWLTGAVNYDEDLHFSSHYLRASAPNRSEQFYPGYTFIIGFYEGFSEKYFLRADECKLNAEVLTRRALKDSTWLGYILDEIVHRSDGLSELFDQSIFPLKLPSFTNAELLSKYRQHYAVHSELYIYARVPEALDRGVNYFTNYLRDHLKSRGVPEADLDDRFNVLTQPVTPSVLAQEILEFERIVSVARHDPRIMEQLLSYPLKARMVLSHGLRERISQHASRWRYLSYHGYGSRRLGDEGDVIERLLEALKGPASGAGRRLLAGLAENRVNKDVLLSSLDIDPPHRELLEIYPEVGAVKLYRRYAQLRNFYFLDMLIAEIARRMEVEEWVMRCALPEEIMEALEVGPQSLSHVRPRRDGCMLVIRGDQEFVTTDSGLWQIREDLEMQAKKHRDRRILKGVIASKGRVQGVCKIVIRPREASGFQRGAILVSESTDPDLLNLLRIAGGVLTQQGGVTAHAAIICREIGIPAIIGIEGLLDTLRDGDVVELDAYTGEVRLLSENVEAPPGMLFETRTTDSTALLGQKAANLLTLQDLGFNIPPFALLRPDVTRAFMDSASASQFEVFVAWLRQRFALEEHDLLAIRSSVVGEDASTDSLAGAYHSLLNIRAGDLRVAFCEFFSINAEVRPNERFDGSVIVQRMVDGDVGGVCLTCDPQTLDTDIIVCEFAAGGAQLVTSGKTDPARLRIRKDTRDILEMEGDQQLVDRHAPAIMQTLVDLCIDIQRHFGRPVDLEWVRADGAFYILQARPIVGAIGL